MVVVVSNLLSLVRRCGRQTQRAKGHPRLAGYGRTLADFRRSVVEDLGADRRLSDRLPPRARDLKTSLAKIAKLTRRLLRSGEVKKEEEKSRKCKLRKTSKVYGRTDPFAQNP